MKTKLIAFNIRELDDAAKEMTNVSADSSIWQLRLAGVAVAKPELARAATEELTALIADFAAATARLSAEHLRRILAAAESLLKPEKTEVMKKSNDLIIAMGIFAALNVKNKIVEIAAFINHVDWAVRRAAILALADLQARDLAEAIAEKVDDNDSLVIRAAIRALTALGARNLINTLAEQSKFNHYNEFIQALAVFGNRDKLQQIVKDGFETEIWNFRVAALYALAALGAKDKIDLIAPHINSDPSICSAAMYALGALGAKDQIEDIASKLELVSPLVIINALWVLASLGATEKKEQIFKCLISERSDVLRAAILALAALDSLVRLTYITANLRNINPDVRQAAADALVYLRRDEPGLADSIFALYDEIQKPELLLALARWHSGILTREYFLKDA